MDSFAVGFQHPGLVGRLRYFLENQGEFFRHGLQKGLVVEDKSRRVANYASRVNHEVELLAHSCGLANARGFRCSHARIVRNAGHSLLLDEIYPYPVGRCAESGPGA